MHTEILNYSCDDVACQGYFVAPDQTKGKKNAAIVIAHAWYGLDENVKKTAHALSDLGYVVLAADLYGNGKIASDDETATSLMIPLFLDRTLLRKRIVAGFEALKKHVLVDPANVGAIGFCFGGMTVIELLRSGAQVKGVVSIHGLLGYTLQQHHAIAAPNALKMNGSLLILHGHKDPMVSSADIQAIQTEFTKANVDWQMHIYGDAMHAFTNENEHEPSKGKQFNPKACARAWTSLHNFFSELFKKDL